MEGRGGTWGREDGGGPHPITRLGNNSGMWDKRTPGPREIFQEVHLKVPLCYYFFFNFYFYYYYYYFWQTGSPFWG